MKERILLVDDEEINRTLLRKVFADDYVVEEACSGSEALRVIEHFHPDIVLLDILMPELNGYEVCRWIKGHEQFRYVKVLLVSGKNRLEDRLEGYEAGADDYITKPFKNSELRAKVKVFLKLKYAEEVNTLKDSILMLLSHETHTPFAGILGYAELLSKSTNLSEEEKEDVAVIINSTKYVVDFTRKVMLLSELKSGKAIRRQEHHIDVIDRIVMGTYPIAKSKGITVEYNRDYSGPVYVDVGLITEAINAVIVNAIEYSSEGSQVVIELCENNGKIAFSVCDQGVGISPQSLKGIFDEFTKSDIKRHKKGHRLSLAIARQILWKHNGDIMVSSVEGVGSTFHLIWETGEGKD